MNATNIRDFFYNIETKILYIHANIVYFIFDKRAVDKIHRREEFLRKKENNDHVVIILPDSWLPSCKSETN